MAVHGCKLRHNSRRGPSLRKDGSRSYRETWVVVVDSPTNDGHVVLGAGGLPQYGTAYHDDAMAVVTDLDPWQSAESELVWYVDVTYTWEPPQPPSSGGQPKPPDGPGSKDWWKPQRFWSTLIYTVYPQADLDGKPYVNSVGDPFEQPPPRIETHRLLTIKQRIANWDEAANKEWIEKATVNEDEFTVDGRKWPAKSALIRRWDGVQNWYPGQDGQQVEYWDRTVDIEFNPQLWVPTKILDQGRAARIPGQAGAVITRDSNGVADGRLALLGGDGYAIPRGQGLPAHWLEFRDYVVKPFARLLVLLEIP